MPEFSSERKACSVRSRVSMKGGITAIQRHHNTKHRASLMTANVCKFTNRDSRSQWKQTEHNGTTSFKDP